MRPAWASRQEVLRAYYDKEWGTPVVSDQEVFRALTLIIFQAGLFWGAVIARAEEFAGFFDDFDYRKIAEWGDEERTALLAEPRMISNAQKLRAVMANARVAAELEESGGLARLVWGFRPATTPVPQVAEDIPQEIPESAALSAALREAGFSFAGPRICFNLMQTIGVVDTNLVGAHRRGSSTLWNDDGTVARHLEIENSHPGLTETKQPPRPKETSSRACADGR